VVGRISGRAKRTRRGMCVLALAAVGAVSACGAPPPDNHQPVAGSGFTGNDTSGVSIPAAMFGPGCSALPSGDAPGSAAGVVDQPVSVAMSSIPALSAFASMVGQAGLGDQLDYSSPAVTVFAPDNAAVSALGGPSHGDVSATASRVNAVIAQGRNNRDALHAEGTVPTLAGGSLTIADTPSGMTVTDSSGQVAHVTCGNISTKNGMIFIVDKVLGGKAPAANGTGHSAPS
jgi:uncharacterized surface protein with fasciclin (FAS1) repeats